MSDTNTGYGRDGDIDSEVAEILAEYDSQYAPLDSDENIREMAQRYGVDVSASYYPREAYPPYSAPGGQAAPYVSPMQYPAAPPSRYDENGGRIVYDADAQPYTPVVQQPYIYYPQGSRGYSQTPPAAEPRQAIPSAAERRKNRAQDSSSVHVLYDAETSEKTAYEAPFENIGEQPQSVSVSDGIEKNRKKEKQAKKKKQPQRNAEGLTRTQRFFKVIVPWSTDSKKEKIRKIVMDVSFFVLFFCAIYFMNYFVELSDAINSEKEMQNLVQAQEPTDDLSQRWAEIRAKYPDVDFPEGMNIDYAELYARNQDFVGWISIENTNIDAPVVQADDNEYYLKHDFAKNNTKYGNSFMDYRNNNKELDQNTIIYGHHMRNNMLFAQLENYMTIEGFSASPVIEFNTAYNNYKWKVYAVFVTNDVREDDNCYLFNYIVPNFHTRESFESYIAALDERKLYDTGVDITADDKILTLSTCSYEFDGARLVVVARMVRDGESEEVDVTKAVANENPRYPQKWYDVNGLSNPYRDAYRWEPNQ